MSRLSPINLPDSQHPPPEDDPYHFSFQNDDETPHFTAKSPSNSHNLLGLSHPPTPLVTGNNRDNPQNLGGGYKLPKEPHKKKGSTSVIIHIKLSDTITKEIRCNLEDNVLELANSFCQENNLSLQAVPVIINMIKQQFSIMLQRMRENPKPQENSVVTDERSKPGLLKQNRAIVNNNTQDSETVKKNMGIRTDNDTSPKLAGKLEVTIGSCQQEIRLFEGEDPVKVAFQFCKENGLPLDLVEVLAIKLEKMRRWYEQKKQQEQLEQRNPFKVGTNHDKDKLSTGSLYQYETAAFATEESDVSDKDEKLAKDQGGMKQQITLTPNDKEHQRREKNRAKQLQPSFMEPDFEDEEEGNRKSHKARGVSNKSPMLIQNQSSQLKTVSKASLLDKEPDYSPRDGEKKLTKNQEQNLMQRLYYKGLAKESVVETSREGRKKPEEIGNTSDLNRSRSQKRSPPKKPTEVVNNKGSKLQLTRENFAFQPKSATNLTSKRIADPKDRSRSPIYEKFSLEELLKQQKESHKQPVVNIPSQKRQSPERTEIRSPGQAQIGLQSRLLNKEEEKREVRNFGVDEKLNDTKPKRKYFQQVINPYKQYHQQLKGQQEKENKQGAGVIIRKNTKKETRADQQENSLENRGGYVDLFDKLDSDNDGFISAQRMDLMQLSPELADALIDLVDMMRDTGLILDYKGFLTAIEQLGLEEKLFNALPRENQGYTYNAQGYVIESEDFRMRTSPRQTSPGIEIMNPEFEDEPSLNIGKKPSKRSDISTASSNQTENSTRSNNFYPELLDRKV